MAFCPNCGTKLPEGGRFCPGCGAAAGAVTPTPAAPVTPAPTAPVTPTPTAPVQPTYVPPVQPAPVTVTQPVKVKGKINWTVFIILMLVGLLIIGAGVAVVVDILDDGEFNLFGLLDSDSSDDDDDDDDDGKKKDDKDDEDEDEDKKDNEDDEDDDKKDNDDDKDPDEDEDEHDPPVATPPVVTQSPNETEATEPIVINPSVEWSYQSFDNGELYLPGTFENGYDGSFYDSTTDTYVGVFLEDTDSFCNDIGIRPTQSTDTIILGIIDYFGAEGLDAQMFVTYAGNYVAVIQWEGSDTRSFYVYPMGDEMIVIRLDTTSDWDDYMYTWFDIVDYSNFG